MRFTTIFLLLQAVFFASYAQKTSYLRLGLDYGVIVNKDVDVRKNAATATENYYDKNNKFNLLPSVSYVLKNKWELGVQFQYYRQTHIYSDNGVRMITTSQINSIDFGLGHNLKSYLPINGCGFFNKSNIWMGVGIKYLLRGSYRFKMTMEQFPLHCGPYGISGSFADRLNPNFYFNYSYDATKWLQLRLLGQYTIMQFGSNILMGQVGLGFKI